MISNFLLVSYTCTWYVLHRPPCSYKLQGEEVPFGLDIIGINDKQNESKENGH